MRANPAVARSDVNTNAPAATCAGPHFIADNGMGGRRALVGSPYVESGVGEIDLIPTQVDKLGRPQAVAKATRTTPTRRERKQDRAGAELKWPYWSAGFACLIARSMRI